MLTPQNDQTRLHICSTYHRTIEFIGRKWIGVIIYSLLDGPKRYYELMDVIDGISDRLLTERLNELVKEGLVKKTFLENSLKKVQYELTPKGKALKDVIAAILHWINQKEYLEEKE